MLNIRHHARIEIKHSEFQIWVNFKYQGMLLHSFDRFYVMTKFKLPKAEDLHLTTVPFNFKCSYLVMGKDKIIILYLVSFQNFWHIVKQLYHM